MEITYGYTAEFLTYKFANEWKTVSAGIHRIFPGKKQHQKAFLRIWAYNSDSNRLKNLAELIVAGLNAGKYENQEFNFIGRVNKKSEPRRNILEMILYFNLEKEMGVEKHDMIYARYTLGKYVKENDI